MSLLHCTRRYATHYGRMACAAAAGAAAATAAAQQRQGGYNGSEQESGPANSLQSGMRWWQDPHQVGPAAMHGGSADGGLARALCQCQSSTLAPPQHAIRSRLPQLPLVVGWGIRTFY